MNIGTMMELRRAGDKGSAGKKSNLYYMLPRNKALAARRGGIGKCSSRVHLVLEVGIEKRSAIRFTDTRSTEKKKGT